MPRENAKVTLEEYGGGADEGQFRGTKNGYLRFGIEIMKGAFADPVESGKPERIQVDVKDLVSNATYFGLDYFYRDESIGDKDFTETWQQRVVGYAFLGFVVFLLACIPFGLYSVGTFIYALFR